MAVRPSSARRSRPPGRLGSLAGMSRGVNALRWTGQPGHYEVYYVTLTDPASGVGIWIRYTMLAPLPERGAQPTCALWFLMMDPRPDAQQPVLARKTTFGIDQLRAQEEPFKLELGGATLTDGVMEGAVEDVWWDLRWAPAATPHKPVHPALERLGLAQTVLVLPHADVAIDGSVGIAGRRLDIVQARGGQAHLWGSKHAESWVWARCSDLTSAAGAPAPGVFFDGVSVIVTRFGRRVGPNTPMVGRFGGRELRSTSPPRILGNRSRFTVDGWEFEASDSSLKVVGSVSARREQLAGVTYHDPDGEEAYCYNSETASVRLDVHQRTRRGGEWRPAGTYESKGRCHFEYAQRTPVPELELLTT
jgi:hypothetical protein